MTAPLSDTRLAAYRTRYAHPHGPVAIANGHVDAAVLLAEVDRLRAGLGRLAALMQDGQHWDGQRLVSEALLSQRDIRRALHWPAPVPPDGPCECKATADGMPVHPTVAAPTA